MRQGGRNKLDVIVLANLIVREDHNRVWLFLLKGIKENIPLPHGYQGIGDLGPCDAKALRSAKSFES
jgi:hypothetical protein